MRLNCDAYVENSVIISTLGKGLLEYNVGYVGSNGALDSIRHVANNGSVDSIRHDGE